MIKNINGDLSQIDINLNDQFEKILAMELEERAELGTCISDYCVGWNGSVNP